jgi:hypothetical protein
MLTALLVLVVFMSAAAIDYVEAYYVRAVADGAAERAAALSLAMYGGSLVGWVVIIKVSLWLLIPEGAGFFVGTYIAVRRQRRHVLRSLEPSPCRVMPSRALPDHADAGPCLPAIEKFAH